MNNLIKENTRVFIPIGVIISCIFAALAFVRSGDIARLADDEKTVKDNTERIHKLEIETAAFRVEQANQVRVLEEVRLDVKVLLAEVKDGKVK